MVFLDVRPISLLRCFPCKDRPISNYMSVPRYFEECHPLTLETRVWRKVCKISVERATAGLSGGPSVHARAVHGVFLVVAREAPEGARGVSLRRIPAPRLSMPRESFRCTRLGEKNPRQLFPRFLKTACWMFRAPRHGCHFLSWMAKTL